MTELRLELPFDVGAATHTGRVRGANEDDYLLLVQQPRSGSPARLLAVIADGMGGAHGGGEASRTAIRAVGAACSAPSELPLPQLRSAFAEACRAVFAAARNSPRLADMGTTLTAALVEPDTLTIAHVGDTRALRLRGQQLTQLTEDHALRGAEAHLTRCVGGGRAEEEVDLLQVELQAGDQLLLASDGLWDVVPLPESIRLLQLPRAQDAATELVREAVRRGGPDNATAVVVRVLATAPPRGIDIPAVEPPQPFEPLAPLPSLLAPRWPWLVLLAGVLLLGVAGLHAGLGIDVVGELFGS